MALFSNVNKKMIPVVMCFTMGNLLSQSVTVTHSAYPIDLKTTLNNSFITSFTDGKTIYFTNTYGSKNRCIYRLKDSVNVEALSFAKWKKLKSFEDERIKSFIVRNDTLILLTDDWIYQFVKKSSKWEYLSSLDNKYNFATIRNLGSKIFLEVCYCFHRLDSDYRNLWGIYNPVKNSVEKTYEPKIDNNQFASIVNSWISTHNGLIAHANTRKYQIHFYNNDFQLIDSVNFQKKYVSEINKNAIDSFDLNSKDGISELIKYDDVNYSRIRKIYLLDSTHLVVIIKLKDNEQNGHRAIRIDILEKQNKDWEIIDSKMSHTFFQNGAVYNDEIISYGGLHQNVSGLIVKDNSIMRIFSPYYPKVMTDSFDRKKDIEHYISDISKLVYGIETYHFSFD